MNARPLHQIRSHLLFITFWEVVICKYLISYLVWIHAHTWGVCSGQWLLNQPCCVHVNPQLLFYTGSIYTTTLNVVSTELKVHFSFVVKGGNYLGEIPHKFGLFLLASEHCVTDKWFEAAYKVLLCIHEEQCFHLSSTDFYFKCSRYELQS